MPRSARDAQRMRREYSSRRMDLQRHTEAACFYDAEGALAPYHAASKVTLGPARPKDQFRRRLLQHPGHSNMAPHRPPGAIDQRGFRIRRQSALKFVIKLMGRWTGHSGPSLIAFRR